MTVAFDAFSSGTVGAEPSWTHTPSGTPAGILALIAQNGIPDDVASVTYNGVSMTAVVGSPEVFDGPEDGAAHAFLLGSSVPSGSQTVAVTDNGGGISKLAGAISLTGAADLEVQDVQSASATGSTPGAALTLGLGGKDCFCAISFWTGIGSTGAFGGTTGWTDRVEADFGAQGAGLITYDTIDSVDVTPEVGTSGTDDYALLAVAITEASVGGGEEVSLSAGSELGSAFSATVAALADVTAAIEAASTVSGRAAALGSITESLEAGDTDAALQAAQAALEAQVDADSQYAAIAQAAAAIQAGLEAGEAWAAIAAAEAGITAGSALGASFVGETESAQQAALAAGTEAAAQFLGAVAAFALLSAGATAADAFAASASVSGAISGSAALGSSFATTTANDSVLNAAASVQAAFSGAVAGLGSFSAQADMDEAFAAIGTALAAISIGVSLGAVFSAASSADVSIIGATASVRAIRRMSATVRSIGLKATIN